MPQELKAKGVSTPTIEAALQKVFGSSRTIRPCDLLERAAADRLDGNEEAGWTSDDNDDDGDEYEDEDAAREHGKHNIGAWLACQ